MWDARKNVTPPVSYNHLWKSTGDCKIQAEFSSFFLGLLPVTCTGLDDVPWIGQRYSVPYFLYP